MQNPITPTLPVQSSRAGEPRTHRLDVVEGAALAGGEVTERRHHAGDTVAAGVEVGCDGEIPVGREPVGVRTRIGASCRGRRGCTTTPGHGPSPAGLGRDGRAKRLRDRNGDVCHGATSRRSGAADRTTGVSCAADRDAGRDPRDRRRTKHHEHGPTTPSASSKASRRRGPSAATATSPCPPTRWRR